MPKHYPPEFKRDVVAVARTSGLTQDEIARDFGISTHSVQRWVKQADLDDGITEGTTTAEQHELNALKRRNRVLQQEVDILSTQALYKWRANPVSNRDWDDAHLINANIDIHADDRQRALGRLTPVEFEALIDSTDLAQEASPRTTAVNQSLG